MDLPSLSNRLFQTADLQQARQHSLRLNRKSEHVPHIQTGDRGQNGPSQLGKLDRLKDQLAQYPDVREEKVAQAAKRVAAGEYLTRDAAERTAERLGN